MRKWIFVAIPFVVAVAVLVAAPLSARAVTYYQPGMLCRMTGSTGLEKVTSYGQFYNGDTTSSLSVACPMAQAESSTQDVEAFKVYYYEDNTGTDTDDQFYCRLQMSTDTGTTYNSSYLWSCNTSTGCTTADSDDNPGASTLSWGNVFSSTAGLVHIGFACSLCEDSPGTCQINGYRMELTGS